MDAVEQQPRVPEVQSGTKRVAVIGERRSRKLICSPLSARHRAPDRRRVSATGSRPAASRSFEQARTRVLALEHPGGLRSLGASERHEHAKLHPPFEDLLKRLALLSEGDKAKALRGDGVDCISDYAAMDHVPSRLGEVEQLGSIKHALGSRTAVSRVRIGGVELAVARHGDELIAFRPSNSPTGGW